MVLTARERKKFSSLIMLDVTISIIDIVSLAILLWIIQFYIQPGNSKNLTFLPQWFVSRDSVWLIAVFFIVFGLKNMAGYFIARAHYRFNSGVAVRISRNNLLHYQH